MPDPMFQSAKPSLAYAKLVATPTENAWAQVYNAGGLFACLSLSLEQPEEGISLPAVGKEIFNNLEAEFFTLEEKNLASIKNAIVTITDKLPSAVAINFCLAFFRDDILYLFILGGGKIVIKRGESVGVLLENKAHGEKSLVTASGYLQNGDSIVLQTSQFAHTISTTTLKEALELALPNDIAESLSPQLHEKDDGGQAAIIIASHGITKPAPFEEEEEDAVLEAYTQPTDLPYPEDQATIHSEKKHFKLPTLPRFPSLSHLLPQRAQMRLSHSKKLFLSIAVILIVLLVASIFLTKKKQDDTHQQEIFQSIYPPAQKYYDEGKGLESLNEELSQQDFIKAESLLKDGQKKFPKGSDEEQQISELLTKVQTELGGGTSETTSLPKAAPATVADDDYLSIEKSQSGKSFAQDAKSVFVLTDKAIVSINKASGKKNNLITNDDDWSSPVAVAAYQGNVYVLDKKDGVLKFVAGSDGFGKTAYFKGDAPDLSKAVAMAIDRSIWILSSDGTILKYTSGESDNLKVSGLEKPLAHPMKIFTDADTSSVYVLDRGNSRVVKLSKDGAFQKAYSADIIKHAQDFEVLEADSKILILANKKIYEISL